MNHRERVMAAIHHEQPDRMPVDFGAMRSTGIMALAYARLKAHMDIAEGDIYVYDTMQQLAYVEPPVRARFGCDVITLDDGLLAGWKPYTLPDGTPAKIAGNFRNEPDGEGGEYALDEEGRRAFHRPASSYYFDPVLFPLSALSAKEAVSAYKPPAPFTDEYLTNLEAEAKRLYEETDYAILGSFGSGFLTDAQGLRGWENFMLDLAGERQHAEALLDRMLAAQLRNVELYLDAVGDYIQIIMQADDLGAQNGPWIRPEMYYDIFQPRQAVIWGRIHQLKPDMAVFLHCCGGVYELIPGLIDAGCDILNPVQISARGMDPARLKREFGGKLCFWGGGCDTQKVLPFGTPEEVYAETRRNIEIFRPGGGYVFNQVHNVQAGVPPENVLAMFAAVHDHWHYETNGAARQ